MLRKLAVVLILFGVFFIALGVILRKDQELKERRQESVPEIHALSTFVPDPNLTPGATLDVSEKEVCRHGYTAEVRDVTTATKKRVFEEYGLSYPPTSEYEVDHFIPLELGGSNDITNLWPEPAEPRPGFHEKDKVETHLHAKVCRGEISLKEAQEQIRVSWYEVYKNLPEPRHKR